MNVPTLILVPLFAAIVIFAVLSVSRLARSWRDADAHRAVALDPELVALDDEKQRLLATLRDLDQEHDLGKLSEADYEGLKRHFERETLRVMDRLEARAKKLGARAVPQ